MANNNDGIPAERKAYMLEAASAMGLNRKLSANNLKTILRESYESNPELQGMYLQADFESRAQAFEANWDPDDSFWVKVSNLIGEQKSQIIKNKYDELRDVNPIPRDFTELKRILKEIQMNKVLPASDLRDNFDNFALEQLLLELYTAKNLENAQFGGKKKTQGKKKTRGKRKGRKSGKSRKAKGKGRK